MIFFSKISNSPLYPMGRKEKTLSYRYLKNKRSEMETEWNLGLTNRILTHVEYFEIVVIKVILGSFGVLAIFPKILTSKHYFFYKWQLKSIKLLLNYPPNGPHKPAFGIFGVKILTIFFSFSLTWNPMRVKSSKRYSYKSPAKVFKFILIFPLNDPHKNI